LVGPDGKESKEDLHITDGTICRHFAKSLNKRHKKIREKTRVAVCDTSNYLHQWDLYSNGKIKKFSDKRMADGTECRETADAINY